MSLLWVKTTNKLEELVKQAHKGEDYNETLSELKQYHHKIARDLLGELPEKYMKFEEQLQTTLVGLNECDDMLAYDKVVAFRGANVHIHN